MDKKDIASFGYDELIEEMKNIEKAFRGRNRSIAGSMRSLWILLMR